MYQVTLKPACSGTEYSSSKANYTKELDVFTMYGHGGHLGHAALTIYKLSFPLSKEAPAKFGINWPRGFREIDV